MRTSLKKILSAVTVVLVSMVWGSAFGDGTSGEDTIDRLLQTPDRLLLVWPDDGAWNNPDGCDTAARAVLDPASVSPESYREKFAAILAAHLAGNSVSFRFSGCFDLGATIPIITNVSIF